MNSKIYLVSKRFLTGIFMGAAGLMPGVSSGTIAVITGIYDDMILSVNYITGREKGKKKHVLFLVNIIAGLILATLLFARFIDHLLILFPAYMSLFFIGLILGTFPMLYNRAKPGRIVTKYWGFSLLGLILVLFFGQADNASATVPETTVVSSAVIALFLAGFLSVGAGLIPGISGSMVLILIGAYSTMISALSEFDLVLLLSMGAGALIGFLVFTRGINYLLQNHREMTYFLIMGLFAGSVFNLWPGLPDETISYVTGFLILAIGFSLAFFSYISRGTTKEVKSL